MLKKYLYLCFAKFFGNRYVPCKIAILSFIFLSVSFQSFGQGVGINTNGVKPDPSAVLDVKSSDKGMLVPRMTTTQRNTIPAPAQSLIIYNTVTNCFEIYLGSWYPLSCVCAGVPATPGAITPSNPSPAVNATGITYTIAAIAGATTYNWKVPPGATITSGQGTTSITVNWGINSGTITVAASNNCGTSGTQSLSVVLVNGVHSTFAPAYTPSLITWTVPASVGTVTITISGAGGGSCAGFTPYPGTGGLGAQIQAKLAVIPGELLNIYLGQQGLSSTSSSDGGAGGLGGLNNDEAGGAGYGDTNNTPWYNPPGWGAGGGGGGASSIRVGGSASVNRVIVAGGGGGAGHDYNVELNTLADGIGGNGGQPGTNGGGVNIAEAGKGGTLIAGGAATVYNTGACNPQAETSTAGGFGYGGNGGMSKVTCEYGGGGGGGGGYY
ncbi:MAG TPA: glycine-rich protein, partial [Bacteroidia bacterium]|nr:glycine-rich protein [Bacteroidia bacterium]